MLPRGIFNWCIVWFVMILKFARSFQLKALSSATSLFRVGRFIPRNFPLYYSRPNSNSANKLFSTTGQRQKLLYLGAFKEELLKCAQTKDFATAKLLYDKFVETGFYLKADAFERLMSTCYKAEHIPQLEKYLEHAKTYPVTETAQLAVMRCHADAGNIEKCQSLLMEMRNSGIDMRLRFLAPVFEAACDKKTGTELPLRFLRQQVDEFGICMTTEQLVRLLAVARAADELKSPYFWSQFQWLLFRAKHAHGIFSMPLSDLLHIESILTNESVEAVAGRGMLYANDSQADVRNIGKPVEKAKAPSSQSVVQTLVDAIDNVPLAPTSSWSARTRRRPPTRLKQPKSCDHISTLSSTDSDFSLKMGITTACVEEVDADVKGNSPDSHRKMKLEPVLVGSGSDDCASLRKEALADKDSWEKPMLPARIIGVPLASSTCPHCGGKLRNHALSPSDSSSIRQALLHISDVAAKHLDAFSSWLRARPPFRYVVDAPNVAYSGQNYLNGKFSYAQIAQIVKMLQERNDGNILVIVPQAYTTNYIPNTVRGRKEELTENDKKILRKLDEADMLYVAPKGSNDDWFWMYVSVVDSHRVSPVFVVTNDLMRDHHTALVDDNIFFRWRNSLIMNFKISRRKGVPVDDDTPEAINVSLNEPSMHSRELQLSASRRWHIPATDDIAWLCMPTIKPVKQLTEDVEYCVLPVEESLDEQTSSNIGIYEMQDEETTDRDDDYESIRN